MSSARLFRVRVRQNGSGAVVATCDAPVCMARAATEAAALEKLRLQIRYRIELCPCTGVDDDFVQLQVERA